MRFCFTHRLVPSTFSSEGLHVTTDRKRCRTTDKYRWSSKHLVKKREKNDCRSQMGPAHNKKTNRYTNL